ncbi:MAG TPA: RluA family pseudouridine synthase [Polyangia bacterium]|jgi:RluA family pseudouridine synthase|nr:RluA family pseudouridine synthase [Polyangia bacterium]
MGPIPPATGSVEQSSPAPTRIEVLYRDDAVVAVAKPAGRIVVPGRSGAAAEVSLRDQLAVELGQRVFVVHRLDRGTSGVLVFALTAAAHRALSMAFERHQADKRYWALCRGSLIGSGEVDRALVPIRGGKARVARDGETNGKSSRTAWRALERYGGFTAVEFRPRTGRLHQVRLHAAYLGHPLAVDPDYGGADSLRVHDLTGVTPARDDADQVVVSRLTLHASSLHLRHPVTTKPLELSSPLPPDLSRAVELLSTSGSGPLTPEGGEG